MKWYDLSLERTGGRVGVRIKLHALHPGLWVEIYRTLREVGVPILKSICLTASTVVRLALKRK